MALIELTLPFWPTPQTRVLGALALVAMLGACTAIGPRSSPLPQDGPTLVDVYKSHMETEGAGGAGTRSPRRDLPLRAVDDDDLTQERRAGLDPLQQRFERLPNPDLGMTVYPHLARGHYPVPGYVTVFPMYERVEYAMPGEVPPSRSRNGEANRLPPQAKTAVAATTCGNSAASQPANQATPCSKE